MKEVKIELGLEASQRWEKRTLTVLDSRSKTDGKAWGHVQGTRGPSPVGMEAPQGYTQGW